MANAVTIQQQQALAMAAARMRQAQAAQQPQPQPAAPAAAPQAPAPAAPVDNGDAGIPGIMGDAVSAMNTLGDTASFGVAPMINRAIHNFFSPGSGDEMQAKIDAVNAAHPAGAAVGMAASIPVDMALAAPLAAAAPEVGALNVLARGGGAMGNAARVAGVGATTGAINAATHGDDPLTGAVVGTVAGGVGAALAKPVSALAEKLITPAATKVWRYLANKLGESPDDMLAHVQRFVQQTGKQPSLQQIVNDHDQGVIAQFGGDYPQAGQVLNAGARASDATLPTDAHNIIQGAQGNLPAPTSRLLTGVDPATATPASLLNARDTQMTQAMLPLRNNPVTISQSLVTDPDFNGALSGRQLRGVRERLANGGLTLDDADTIRQKLASKVEKSGDDIDQVLQDFNQEVAAQNPAYADLLGHYSNATAYAKSFAHGASGGTIGGATDSSLRHNLSLPEGQAGFNAGSLSRTANQAAGSPAAASGVLGDISRPGAAQGAFRAAAGTAAPDTEAAAAALHQAGDAARGTAPGALRPQAETSASATNIGMGLAEAPIAPISAVRNVSRGLLQAIGAAPRISPDMQREIANSLVSGVPHIRDAALMQLRRAGVSDARLKLIQALAAGNAARAATTPQVP